MDTSKVRIAPCTPQPVDILSTLHSVQMLGPENLYDALCQLLLGNTDHIGLTHVQARNSSLADICERIDRSKSWMYENNIVPIYNAKGAQTNKDKTPRFPWEQLPHVIEKIGKKEWTEASILAWKLRVDARANQLESSPVFSPMTYQENRHD